MVSGITKQEDDKQLAAGWRIKVAFTLFIVSTCWPVVVPVLPFFGLSGTQVAAFSGVAVVVAELMLLAGVAVAGKDGFAYIKAKVFGVLKAYGPPKTVSRTRYTIGLVMLGVPALLGWGAPYFGHHLPGYVEHTRIWAIAGDVLLVLGLIMLGGDFWDKLRSLFVHEARAVFPEKPAKGATAAAPGPGVASSDA